MKKKKQGISMIVTIIIVSIVIICIGLIVYFLFNKNSSKKDGNSSNSLETQESVGKTSDGVAKPEDYRTSTVNENEKTISIDTCENKDAKICDIPSKIDGETVVSIRSKALAGKQNLEEVIVPGTVEKIGEFAFFLNSKLKKVTLNEGVKEIGKKCFSQDTALVEVSLPSTLKTISVCAFIYCPNLERVTIPNGVERIEDGAFAKCEKLKEVHIPSSVNFIQTRYDGDSESPVFEESPNVTIYAPKGSYAEKYAKQENIKFVAE